MLLKTLLLATAAAILATPAHAQSAEYPTKPITIIVPFPPGGVTDQLARGVGQKLSENLNVTVIVDNRPGGGAQIAANAVKQAPADGHTVFIGDMGAFALNPSLYPKLSYQPQRDFTPVARLVMAPSLLVVSNSTPYQNVGDLAKAAKTRSSGVTMASQSQGSGGHLFIEMLKRQSQGQVAHVPYRGSAPALNDMLGGQVEALFDPIITSGPFVKDGKLRAIAVGANQRSPLFPDVPTLQEQGYGSINLVAWFGMAVKAGTPQPIVERLSTEVIKALRAQDVSKRFTDQGLEIATLPSSNFGQFLAAEEAKWGKLIKDAGITPE